MIVFFPNLKTKEDFVLWLNILDRNIKIGSLNENLSSWRKLNNSLSSSTFQKILDGYKVYKVYMKFNFLKIYLLFSMFIIKLFKEKLVYELYHLYYCIFHFYYLSKLFIENKKSNSQLFWQPTSKVIY